MGDRERWQRMGFKGRTLSVAVFTDPPASDIEELKRKLLDYNTSRVGPENFMGLLITLRNAETELVGGIAGKIYYQWFFIEWFWVAEHMRGQGQGRSLLVSAEEEARRRGCQHAWLDTFSFQARGFYEKNGYVLFGELPDYPPGHQRYFLRKQLNADKA
jgi:GNAT superfamily N-acetyltransferase